MTEQKFGTGCTSGGRELVVIPVETGMKILDVASNTQKKLKTLNPFLMPV